MTTLAFRIKRDASNRLAIAFLAISFIIIFLLLQTGGIERLAFVLAGVLVVLLIYQKPEIGIALAIISSTTYLGFIPWELLPSVSLPGGMDLRVVDGILMVFFLTGALRLARRKEYPIFLKPFLLFGLVVLASLLLSWANNSLSFGPALGTIRDVFAYSFYFALVGHIDKEKDLRFLMQIVFFVLVSSAIFQAYEIIMGKKIVIFNDPMMVRNYRLMTSYLTLQGRKIPYIWNRAVTYSFLALFLAIGGLTSGVLRGRKKIAYLVLAGVGVLVFILQLTRGWYFYIGCGMIAIILFRRTNRLRFVWILVGAFLVLVVLGGLMNYFLESGQMGVFWRFVNRFETISGVFSGTDRTFYSRVDILKDQLLMFRKSPLYGYGFTTTFLQARNSDIGFANTLLRFGIVGVLFVLYLIKQFWQKVLTLWRRLPPSIYRGYVLGLMGMWTGMIVGYSFNWDFFTGYDGIFLVCTTLAIIDRMWKFHFANTQAQVRI